MSKLDDILTEIKGGIGDLARKSAKDFAAEVTKDGNAFVREIQADLKRWVDLLGKGKLSPEEFQVLLEFNRDLAEMKASTKAGMAKKRVQDLTDGILAIISKTVLKLV